MSRADEFLRRITHGGGLPNVERDRANAEAAKAAALDRLAAAVETGVAALVALLDAMREEGVEDRARHAAADSARNSRR